MSTLFLTGCRHKNEEMIEEAIELLAEHWDEIYVEDDLGDGYFEIKNTRVIHIKENDIEQFKNAKYIIEFDLYTDYMGTAPYYSNVGMYSNVVVNNDGSMEVATRVIDVYRSITFDTDYSDFIEEIIDYHGEYNCVRDLE